MKMMNHILEETTLLNSFLDEDKLKEYVGHTPIQVIAGCLLGLLVGWLLH